MLNFSLGGRGAKAPARGTGSSFAHLMGLSKLEKSSGEDEPDEKSSPQGEDDEKDEKKTVKKAETEEDDAAEDEKSPAAASSDPGETAEDDDTDEDAPPPEDGEDDDKKVKKARAAGFGPAISAARRMERARCAAILGAPAAAKNVALAASLACETCLTPAQALRVMAKGGDATNPSARLNARMNAMDRPRLGGDGEGNAGGAHAIAAGWERVMASFVPAR